MGAAWCAVVAFAVTTALAACATVNTTSMESQNKARDARLARLYFIWPRSMMFKTATFDIKVDGKIVGKIAPDSYFFSDQQPGTHTLKIEPPFDWTYFETDVQVAAGGTYYYSVHARPAQVGVTVIRPIPDLGTPMEPKAGRMATYKLNAVDRATATAEMTKLDAQPQ
jgi:hypothetical protein